MITHIKNLLPHHSSKEKIGVAVSMGVDSLASCLYLLKRSYNLHLIHYNHNLRPQNIEMQKNFWEFFSLFKYYDNVTASSNRVFSEYNNWDENQCRQNRLDFFSQACAEENIKIIITAHHLDDYVESYLLNCFRGKPNFKPINLVSDFVHYKIIHPFLLTEKEDFIEYIRRADNGKYQKFLVNDETNNKIKGSRRNWIRKVIIPELASQKISLKKFCRQQIQEQISVFAND